MTGEIEKHIVNFLYIISFLVGISTIILTVLPKKNDARIYHNLRAFVISFFLSLLTYFIFFYREYFLNELNMVPSTLILYYVTFVALLYSWVQLICQSATPYSEYRLFTRAVKICGILYIIVGVFICQFFVDDQGNIINLWAKISEIASNTVLLIPVLWCTFKYAFGEMKSPSNNRTSKVLSILSIGVILFIVWVYWVELSWINVFTPGALALYPFDLAIIFYLLLNMFIFVYIYRTEFKIQEEHGPKSVNDDVDFRGLVETAGVKYNLTNREREVLLLIYQGQSYSKTAETLCISLNTVKRHVDNIFKKTVVNNRVELIHLILGNK